MHPTIEYATPNLQADLDERMRFERAVASYAHKILAAIDRAASDPDDSIKALATWEEVLERMDLRCWAIGFEAARGGYADEQDERAWREAVPLARRAYQRGLDALLGRHLRLQADADFSVENSAAGYYVQAQSCELGEGNVFATWYGTLAEVTEIARAMAFPHCMIWRRKE